MKKFILLFALLISISSVSFAQSMSKKFKTFEVSREMPFSADRLWAAVAEDYGNIAKSHPKIVSSNYTSGSLKGEKGAQRHCTFNKKGSRMLHEEITDWNPEEGYFVNRILEAKKFPVDVDNTQGTYHIIPMGPNKSKFVFKMEFRTKPAFMAGMAKGKFKKLIQDYMIAVQHNVATGESVTADNFKAIKKNYSRS